jgi:hypothetical protein
MQKLYKSLAALLVVILGVTHVQAQFENKVTFNFSLGAIQPIGIKDYTYKIYSNQYTTTRVKPYVFPNYNQGFTFTGGAMFNINRFFSVGTGVGVERIGSWEYTEAFTLTDFLGNSQRVERDFLAWKITANEGETILRQGENDLSMYNFSIGVFPRVNLAYGKKVNPYVFVEITFNYTDINYINNMRDAWIELGGTEQDFDDWYNSLTIPFAFKNTPQSSFGVGLYPGIGFDFNLTRNLGIFLQGGYSFISINKSDMEAANLEPENFKTVKVELGVKLSFLRSKDI